MAEETIKSQTSLLISSQTTWSQISAPIEIWSKLTNIETATKICRRLAVNPAEQPFQSNILFQILLGDKTIVAKNHKLNGDEKLYEFFSHDFSQPKWKKAASDNAKILTVLGTKLDLEMAVSLMVLGGHYAEAIDICLKKLEDSKLALLVARMVADLDDMTQYKRVLNCVIAEANSTGDIELESMLRFEFRNCSFDQQIIQIQQ